MTSNINWALRHRLSVRHDRLTDFFTKTSFFNGGYMPILFSATELCFKNDKTVMSNPFPRKSANSFILSGKLNGKSATFQPAGK